MKKPLLILLLVLVAASMAMPVSASYLVNISNTSAQQLGGAYNAYEFANGDDKFEIFTVVPLTVQGIVYPLEFWYASFYISWLCLILGILMTVFKDRVPSTAIVAFGLLAWGGFMICAFMLPYTASMYVDTQVVQNFNKDGTSTGNNSVYITQVADYRASPPHAYICYGLSVAGFIEMVLGALSYTGWFQSKGLRDAGKGKYVETEDGDVVNTRFAK